MPTILALHTRERRSLFIYLLLATLLLTGIASRVVYLIYNAPPGDAAAQSQKISAQQRIFEAQRKDLPLLDSLHQLLVRYNPKVTASFVNADIQSQLTIIRHVYLDHDTLAFYRSFDQAADFYQMMYQDKQLLANQQENRQLFAKELQNCQSSSSLQQVAPQSTVSPIIPPPPASPLLSQ